MELRNINTFLHIAELHSFSSAARELGYSQSAVSAQISQLETELGTPLFDRVGKTVRLTDAGQTFQSYARTLLITAQQAKAALVPARAVSGTLRVALADSVCSTFLPDLLQQFHALCPQVELVLRTATADEMLRLLSANQIDLAYTLDQPLLLPSLTLAVNVPEPVCFVAAPYIDADFTQGASDDARAFASSLTMPFCGPNLGFEPAGWLAAEAGEPAQSIALLPLREGAIDSATPAFGLLVLGSQDPQRFDATMGTDFLARMAELASAALIRLK